MRNKNEVVWKYYFFILDSDCVHVVAIKKKKLLISENIQGESF